MKGCLQDAQGVSDDGPQLGVTWLELGLGLGLGLGLALALGLGLGLGLGSVTMVTHLGVTEAVHGHERCSLAP